MYSLSAVVLSLLLLNKVCWAQKPFAFATEFPAPELSENLKNIMDISNEDSLLVLNPCGGRLCYGSTLDNLKNILAKLNMKGMDVYIQIMANYDIIGVIDEWANIDNIQGLYFYDLTQVSFDNTAQVNDVVTYINHAKSLNLDVAVNVNSVPHVNISEIATIVNVYDGDTVSFTADCLGYGQGPFCRIPKTDASDVALNYLINESPTILSSYIDYNTNILEPTELPNLVQLNKDASVSLISISDTPPWRASSKDYLISFFSMFGDDCDAGADCNNGQCVDDDLVENDVFSCACPPELSSGERCELFCQCPDSNIAMEPCTNTTNATCQEVMGSDCDNFEGLCGSGICTDDDEIVNNEYNCTCPEDRNGNNCEFNCACDDGEVVNRACTSTSDVVCSRIYRKTFPLTFIARFAGGETTECTDTDYSALARLNENRGDAIIVVESCVATSFNCTDNSRKRLQVCINALADTGAQVFFTIPRNYESIIEQTFALHSNITGYYLSGMEDIKFDETAGVDDALSYINLIKSKGLKAMINTNGLPNERITRAADFIFTYFSGRVSFTQGCHEYGPGPYCFLRKNDVIDSAIDLINSPDTSAVAIAHVGFDNTEQDKVYPVHFEELIGYAEANNVHYLSLQEASYFAPVNETYIDLFYQTIGQDDCGTNPCLNGGVCIDPDRENDGVFTCNCDFGFLGTTCENVCHCLAGSITIAPCSATTNVTCEECGNDFFVENDTCTSCTTDSYCLSGVRTQCLNGTFVDGYSCQGCPLTQYCTGGIAEICPEGTITIETNQSECVPCIDNLCSTESSDPKTFIIVGAVLGTIFLILTVLGLTYWYRRYQEKKKEPKLPKNMTAEDFALQTDEEFEAEEIHRKRTEEYVNPLGVELLRGGSQVALLRQNSGRNEYANGSLAYAAVEEDIEQFHDLGVDTTAKVPIRSESSEFFIGSPSQLFEKGDDIGYHDLSDSQPKINNFVEYTSVEIGDENGAMNKDYNDVDGDSPMPDTVGEYAFVEIGSNDDLEDQITTSPDDDNNVGEYTSIEIGKQEPDYDYRGVDEDPISNAIEDIGEYQVLEPIDAHKETHNDYGGVDSDPMPNPMEDVGEYQVLEPINNNNNN